MQKRFELDPNTKDFYFKKMCESFRRHKTELRTKYYDKFNNYDERLKNCPPTISQDDWEGFLKNEEKPGVIERREICKKTDQDIAMATTPVEQVMLSYNMIWYVFQSLCLLPF